MHSFLHRNKKSKKEKRGKIVWWLPSFPHKFMFGNVRESLENVGKLFFFFIWGEIFGTWSKTRKFALNNFFLWENEKKEKEEEGKFEGGKAETLFNIDIGKQSIDYMFLYLPNAFYII